MTQSQDDAAPSDAVDAQLEAIQDRDEAGLESEIEADAVEQASSGFKEMDGVVSEVKQPDPETVKRAEAELAMRRIQGQAAGFLGVLPVQVVRLSPVSVEGVDGQSFVDITVRVDTRSFEWQRTFAQRVVRPQQ